MSVRMVSCPGWWLVLAGSSLSTSSRAAQDNKNPLGQLGEELPAFTNSLANMSVPVERDVTFTCNVKAIGQYRVGIKPFIYEARESSLVTEGFLTAQFLQKLLIYETMF